MTRLISEAFRLLRTNGRRHLGPNKKPTRAAILLVDEADVLAQYRELAQMHDEDRAGVNALIRGIDDIANAKLSCLTIICSNRLSALDPAVKRRAAAIFEFVRATLEFRKTLLTSQLTGTGLSAKDVDAVAAALGETDGRKYVYNSQTSRSDSFLRSFWQLIPRIRSRENLRCVC